MQYEIEWWGVGVVMWLEWGADCLQMVQLMPVHPKTPSSLASFKSRLVLPFWYRLTQVVLEKRPLNGCSISCSSSSNVVVNYFCRLRSGEWWQHFGYYRCLLFLNLALFILWFSLSWVLNKSVWSLMPQLSTWCCLQLQLRHVQPSVDGALCQQLSSTSAALTKAVPSIRYWSTLQTDGRTTDTRPLPRTVQAPWVASVM